jgi:pimeloyl-ACP methyl ester carboxylesterase
MRRQGTLTRARIGASSGREELADYVTNPDRQPFSSSSISNHDHRLSDWWARGEHIHLELSGEGRSVFVRRGGYGPPLTLLHGYPSSSYQWAKTEAMLAESHSLLTVDFLGFGASDKPHDHAYSLFEQADLVAGLWARDGIGSTRVAAQGYGASVGQELLARRAERTLAVDLVDMVLLNGGIYPELHRPIGTQSELFDPVTGPKLSEQLSEQRFVADLAPSFATGYDGTRRDCLEMWDAYIRDDGQLNSYLLVQYIAERHANRARWVHAHETTDLPLTFIWGLQDPISGAQMAAQIKRSVPTAALHELPGVAHWPPLEAPNRVAELLLEGPSVRGPRTRD